MRMQARRKTLAVLKQHDQKADGVRVAMVQYEAAPQEPVEVETKGVKRDIPKGFAYDARALKPLAKMLWSMSVSLGHALTAHRHFTKLKSSTVSPDGMIGGRGYVMAVKDVRKMLHDACEALSAISDTIHDEINAPHWKPQLARLEKEDMESVERLIGDAERILDDPETDVEEGEEDAAEHGAPWHHPATRKNEEKGSESSQMPSGGDAETVPSQGPHPASPDHPFNRQVKQANSSLPVQTIPGGPRVEHLDRGDTDKTGPFGSQNTEEPQSLHDEWSRTDGAGRSYAYPSDWSEDLHDKAATSAMPDANSDTTPTEGYDYGIGRSNGDQARGQGAGGYGTDNSESGARGVYGPRADLPDDAGGQIKDREESDSTPRIENQFAERAMIATWSEDAEAELPNDDQPGVARSDYYQGPKGSNMTDVAPSTVGAVAESAIPGDESNRRETDIDVGPSLTYRYEQVDEPYVRWDDNTHNMRPDPVYQRDPVQGPFVKPAATKRPSDG